MQDAFMPQMEEKCELSLLDRGRMRIRMPFLVLFLHHGLGSAQAVMDFSGGELIKEQGSRSVCRFSLKGSDGETSFFLKRHHHSPLGEQIRESLRRGRWITEAQREWESIWKIKGLGIPTVDPVGYGELKRWGWVLGSFLISEELRGVWRMTDFIPRHFSLPPQLASIPTKRDLIRKVALLARCLHEKGLFHRDFYLGHLFVRPMESGEWEIYLLDLQRVIRSRWRSARWRIKDLASLNFSAPKGWFTATDRLRFYKHYRGIDRLTPRDRSLIDRITKKSQRIFTHTLVLLEKGKILRAPWGLERDAA